MQSPDLTSLMQEIEIQKKRMNLAALSSLQQYMKQLLSVSLLQQNIRKSTTILIQPPQSDTAFAEVTQPSTQSSESMHKLIEVSRVPTQKETQSHSLASANDIQVKCEEQPVIDNIKIEEEKSEELRKSDSESPNSLEIEEHHDSDFNDTRSRPLFNLFAEKKKELACEHTWRKHHAKGLCKRCYEKYGRTKKPWNCEHQVHFARGLCRKCYFKSCKKVNLFLINPSLIFPYSQQDTILKYTTS